MKSPAPGGWPAPSLGRAKRLGVAAYRCWLFGARLAVGAAAIPVFVGKSWRTVLGLMMFLFVLPAFASSELTEVDIAGMQVTEHVHDETGTLDAGAKLRLNGRLRSLEQRSGAQVVVMLIDGLGGRPIEVVADAMFKHLKPGRTGIDDGVLVLVAKNDRRTRIEVGYGLEGAIPDAVASRIIRERMTSAFRKDDFAGGIDAALDALIPRIEGESLPDPISISISISGMSEPTLVMLSFAAGAILRMLGSARLLSWGLILTCGLLLCGLNVGLVAFGQVDGLSLNDGQYVLEISAAAQIIGAMAFAAIWRRKIVRYSLLGLIAYCCLVLFLSLFFGVMILVYALVIPVGVLVYAGLAWAAFMVMRRRWQENRRSFYRRLLLPISVALLSVYPLAGREVLINGMTVSAVNLFLPLFGSAICLLVAIVAFTNKWAVFADGVTRLVAQALRDRRSGHAGSTSSDRRERSVSWRGSSGGGSSGRGGFSGRGGRSGGGGASGSW
jgi:uncharacterized protein